MSPPQRKSQHVNIVAEEEYYFGTLSSMIGPGRALKSANLAEDNKISLKEACTRLGYCSSAEFDGMMDPVRRTFISH